MRRHVRRNIGDGSHKGKGKTQGSGLNKLQPSGCVDKSG